MNPFPDETFFALVPIQALTSEPGEDGTTVLIRPKVMSPRWGWLVRLMAKPNYRVKLDARGSAVWQACDGTRTVGQVAEAVAAAFPGEADATRRTALFVRELALGKFIRFAQVDPRGAERTER